MKLKSISAISRWLFALLILLGPSSRLLAAPTGPTLHFDYGQGKASENPVNKFMYFVPLISPVTVSVFTNLGNTQSVRVTSWQKKISRSTFSVNCTFDFTGRGSQKNIFDDAHTLVQHAAELVSGKTLHHQLGAIDVEGDGGGSAEITGTVTNGILVVNELKLHFNRGGQPTPVSIVLYDLRLQKDHPVRDNYTVARVNMLDFKRTIGIPKMEVTLASIKKQSASNSLWQNFLGSLKGAAANLFIPPLRVQPEGQAAMLRFAQALADEKPEFTFPFATRLKETSVETATTVAATQLAAQTPAALRSTN